MDFQIKSDSFRRFLTKCRLSGLIKDLMLQGSDGKLYARFTDTSGTMYCEVLENSVKITEAGSIRIIALDKLLSVINRSDSELMRVKSNDNLFVITDGNEVGKFRADLTQAGEAEYIESYQKVSGASGKIFDRESLEYVDGKYKFTDGFEVPLEMLQTILKDAKAFGFEVYRFSEKEGKLSCSIEDKATGEKFNRKVQVEKKIGNPIEAVTVGMGFREMIGSLERDSSGDKNKKEIVKLYFNPSVLLITNGDNYYYCLHAISE